MNHVHINYDVGMRTTVDLPPIVHQRVRKIATDRGESISAVLADLAMRGLAQLDYPVELSADSRTGLPVLSISRRVTAKEVSDALADDL